VLGVTAPSCAESSTIRNCRSGASEISADARTSKSSSARSAALRLLVAQSLYCKTTSRHSAATARSML